MTTKKVSSKTLLLTQKNEIFCWRSLKKNRKQQEWTDNIGEPLELSSLSVSHLLVSALVSHTPKEIVTKQTKPNDSKSTPSLDVSNFNSNNSESNSLGSSTFQMLDSISVSNWASRLYEDRNLNKPSRDLMYLIDRSENRGQGERNLWRNMIRILNRAMNRLLQHLYSKQHDQNNDFQTIVSDSGEILLNNASTLNSIFPHLKSVSRDSPTINDTEKEKLITSLLSLYYVSLERILLCETQRTLSACHGATLKNETFHRALLSISSECIVKAYFPSIATESILNIMEINGFEFFKIIEGFVRALSRRENDGYSHTTDETSQPAFLLPPTVVKYLVEREIEILDASIWINPPLNESGGLVETIRSLHSLKSEGLDEKAWPPPCLQYRDDVDDEDEKRNLPVAIHKDNIEFKDNTKFLFSVEFVMRKLLVVCARRILGLASMLMLDHLFLHRIWVGLRFFFRNHIYVLYDHHVDHIILSVIYGVCKIIGNTDITFARIVQVYQDFNSSRGESCNQKIIRHIFLEEAEDGTMVFGNIIQFYNRIFVPTMKPHLLKNTDADYLLQLKSRSIKVVQHIEDTAACSHSNNSCESRRLSQSTKIGNVLVEHSTKEDKEYVMEPRGRTYFQFGGGINNQNLKLMHRTIHGE